MLSRVYSMTNCYLIAAALLGRILHTLHVGTVFLLNDGIGLSARCNDSITTPLSVSLPVTSRQMRKTQKTIYDWSP